MRGTVNVCWMDGGWEGGDRAGGTIVRLICRGGCADTELKCDKSIVWQIEEARGRFWLTALWCDFSATIHGYHAVRIDSVIPV